VAIPVRYRNASFGEAAHSGIESASSQMSIFYDNNNKRKNKQIILAHRTKEGE
jgi:hypothetical protein